MSHGALFSDIIRMVAATMMKIGSVIKELRERAGLTQGQLGIKVGVSDSAICQIEKNRTKNPRLALVARILHALKTPPGYAFEKADLPVYSDNPGSCFPPMVEICELIMSMPEGPRRQKLEGILLEIARSWRDHTE